MTKNMVVIIVFGCTLINSTKSCESRSIKDYFVRQIDYGGAEYPSMQGISMNVSDSLTMRLMEGNIVEFMNGSYETDALIISTNVSLTLSSDSPGIQAILRQQRPDLVNVIEEGFQNYKGRHPDGLDAVSAGLLIKTGKEPSQLCFIATDRSDGGTYDTKWPEINLYENRLEIGVRSCLDQAAAAGARSVVMPLLGSSSPPPGFANFRGWRALRQIQRMCMSLGRLMTGVELHLRDRSKPTVTNLGILIFGPDIDRIRKAERGAPAADRQLEYGLGRDLKDSLLRVFDYYAGLIQNTGGSSPLRTADQFCSAPMMKRPS